MGQTGVVTQMRHKKRVAPTDLGYFVSSFFLCLFFPNDDIVVSTLSNRPQLVPSFSKECGERERGYSKVPENKQQQIQRRSVG